MKNLGSVMLAALAGAGMGPLMEPYVDGVILGPGRRVRRNTERPISAYDRKHLTSEWRAFAAKVMSTHRFLPDGTFQDDPRHDKYLHSSARTGRGLRRAIAARSK